MTRTYNVVRGSDFEMFLNDVNRYKDSGWHCQGGIYILEKKQLNGNHSGASYQEYLVYFQAIVKEKP
jgi:hypothetical protein